MQNMFASFFYHFLDLVGNVLFFSYHATSVGFTCLGHLYLLGTALPSV